MADDNSFRRAWLRGYRQGDVELAIARATLAQEQLQHELDAARARANEMQTELKELNRRVDSFRQRETELTAALDEVRERREQLERESKARAQEIVGEAEQRAATLRTEGLRQVGELQQQVEQLLGLRAGLSTALKRVTQDISDSLDRLAAAPARAVEQIQTHPAPESSDDVDERFARWSDTES
ncbi:MAG: DivIVA domain-containing protein [Gaiellaceae bacterium]